MARRLILAAVAMTAVVAALGPAGANAATAPASAPVLISTPFVYPAVFRWTPGVNLTPQTQAVYRRSGNCATTLDPGGLILGNLDNSVNTFTARPLDGIYCYFIRVTDIFGTADSPGLTVAVDTTGPVATVSVSGQNPAGAVSGTVSVSGTSSDAVSGVATSTFHVGAVGGCPAGPVVGASWDTATSVNGVYDVCNVVIDNAGHVATAAVTVTVANPVPLAAAPPQTANAAPVIAGVGPDNVPPGAPTKLSVLLPRAKAGAGKVRVTLRWVKPAAADLDRVVVVLNLKRAPRGPADGSKVYRGLGTSVALNLRAGQTGYLALFAYDHSGNVSKPARRVVSLASLIPLRPLTGSVVDAAPRLTWKAQEGILYYNVQLFRNGRRVLVGWPSHASYVVPAGALLPGTYVWFVWPAIKHGSATPTFGDLIGRATFVVTDAIVSK
jgi:hypothetical protein